MWIWTAPCSLLHRNFGQVNLLNQVPKLDQVSMIDSPFNYHPEGIAFIIFSSFYTRSRV